MIRQRFPGRLLLPGTLVVIAVGISAVASAHAQRNPATIDDLLAEIRGLRADLSRTAGATMRMQLLTARLSLQEQRITVLANQRADVSTRLAAAVRERSEVEARVKDLQAATPGPGLPREELEAVLKAETTRLSQRREVERQLRARETELTELIATEQGRWTDFNGRLDELERSLPTAGAR
jgi:chromosome segregation ATPase